MSKQLVKIVLIQITVLFSFLSASSASAQSTFVDVEHGGQILCGILDNNSALCTAEYNFEARTPTDLQPVQDIAANSNTACAVLVSGDLRCWGQDGFDLLDAPTSGAPYKSISMGIAHACAINSSDQIECWGVDSNNRLGAPTGQFTQLSLSRQQACALDFNGAVSCWGANDQGTIGVPFNLPQAQKVVSGNTASCALLLDGSIQCWGKHVESLSGPFVDFDLVASGSDASNGSVSICAIDTNGEIGCQYLSYTGEGDFTVLTSDQTLPEGVGNTDISMSGLFSGCYINAEGTIECFGFNSSSVLIPSAASGSSVADVEELRSQVYSASTVELFWDSPSQAFNIAGHEIQRNGDEIIFTQNASSFLFDDLSEGVTETFAVRRISIDGTAGDFSDSISVSTMNGQPDFGPNPTGYQPPERPFAPTDLFAETLCSDVGDIFWLAGASNNLIDGYEIHRDGTFIGFTSDLYFFDEQITSGVAHNYDVIAIDLEDPTRFFGVASIVLEVYDDFDEDICS